MNTCDIRGIDILPHRDPFLFMDRLISYSSTEAIGEVTFGEDRDFFRGHFPGFPIVPGVVLLEAMAQVAAAGTLMMRQKDPTADKNASNIFLFAGADKVRFRRPVRPGDCLRTHATVIRVGHGLGRFHVEGLVDNEVVVEADIFCLARKES